MSNEIQVPLLRFTTALIVFVAVFALIRFGGWAGALMVVRTPIYFAMVKVMAWFWASVLAVVAYLHDC